MVTAPPLSDENTAVTNPLLDNKSLPAPYPPQQKPTPATPHPSGAEPHATHHLSSVIPFSISLTISFVSCCGGLYTLSWWTVWAAGMGGGCIGGVGWDGMG